MKTIRHLGALCLMLLLSHHLAQAQQKYTISGYVEDSQTGEKLIGANLFDLKSLQGAVTNTYGFFSLTLPRDSVVLQVSYIGFQNRTIRLFLDKNMTLNTDLGASLELATVEVSAERSSRIEQETQMSRVEVPIEQLKKVPALLGEVDVLKVLQLLPGVQSGGEGQNGLYVRGGSPDQNLVLLDGVPVYNVSHLLGIFSVFNADAIKNVTLTKGGFPARYGGRLSSVLEINMKEGNSKEFHGEGSIGLISSKLTLEGPIIKDKTSFIVSARRTYADIIAAPFVRAAAASEGAEFDLDLYFYDVNAKVNHKINDKHRLYLSFYGGADVFGNRIKEDDSTTDGGVNWGNTITSLRWNYMITNKLFANTNLTYSKYNIDIKAGFSETRDSLTESFRADYFSGIEDIGGRLDFDYIPLPNHYIRFGAAATHHTYSPGALVFKFNAPDALLDTTLGSGNITSMEYSLYAEDDIRIGAVSLNVGVHAAAFDVGTSFYTSLQPRLGLRYLLPRDVALKASYSRMTQFINLLTNESFSLPTDLWVPSTDRVKPQESWQAAIGAAKTFADQYECSIEAYYKKMNNVVSYKPGASFLFGLENDWQDKVTQGVGETYGLEFFFQKKTGRFTGWVGYTLSWNNRTFDEINGGKTFAFRYDRRHDISVVGSYDINKKWSANMAWVFGTGNSITLPTTRYAGGVSLGQQDDQFYGYFYEPIENTGEKNGFRMANYHRLDLGFSRSKIKTKWTSTWSFGAYNSYNRANPYYIYRDTKLVTDPVTGIQRGQPVFKQVSILPIIPYVSWGFKF